MGPEGLQRLLAGDLLPILAGGQDSDDVPVGHGGMYQNAGGLHVGHDGHQVHRLVAGGLVDLEGVGQPPVVVAGIRHAADDGDGHLLHPHGPVQAVHSADEPRGVAAGQL